MASNADAAEIFRTIADLLDLLGETFKPEAYRRAARSIESLTEDLGAVAARHELRAIPGVGEAIAEKIEEYLRTGSVSYYERLKREIPPGLVELMRLPGLGPKTARRFWVELGVEGPSELGDAIAAGRLVGMKGFGEKKIEQLRSALTAAAAGPGPARRPIEEVYPVARELVRALRKVANADRVEVAGSFRRARETVGDLDILVTSRDPGKVFETFTAHPFVAEVRMRGETKETVLLAGGLQVDLRVVQPAEFGAALQYFTGSKDHNVRLRSLARDRGLKVNEYGVFRGEERIAGATEEEVYASLGLAWIPPELREDRGEIELAARGKVPPLVSGNDLRGDLHIHLAPDARPDAVDRIVAEARALAFAYVGVLVGGVRPDGTVWILPDTTRSHLAELHPPGLRVACAVETGVGPMPKELAAASADYRIVRPLSTSAELTGPGGATRPPTLVAHVGASVASDPTTLVRWVEEARRAGAAIEVGPGPERLDSAAGRQACEGGVAIHLPTGLGAAPDDPTRVVAVGFARRAGAPREKVTNARPLEEVSAAWPGSTRGRIGASNGLPRLRPGKRRPAS
jgi:DNA polymerase/3'-5' exonuclease PolX